MATRLEDAQAALAAFRQSMLEGNPWVPGVTFINNPGLDEYVLMAHEEFVREHRIAEQSKPAERVSLSDDPNWLPWCVAPDRPKKTGWKRLFAWW